MQLIHGTHSAMFLIVPKLIFQQCEIVRRYEGELLRESIILRLIDLMQLSTLRAKLHLQIESQFDFRSRLTATYAPIIQRRFM